MFTDEPRDGIHADLVCLDHDGSGTQLVQVPDERVDEAVVVVDYEHRCDARWICGHPTVASCGVVSSLIQGKT